MNKISLFNKASNIFIIQEEISSMLCFPKQQLMAQTHSHCLQFMNGIFSFKKIYGPFLWMGFNCLKARATSRRQITFFTSKFPEIPGTHFINLRWMKAESTGPNTGQKWKSLLLLGTRIFAPEFDFFGTSLCWQKIVGNENFN